MGYDIMLEYEMRMMRNFDGFICEIMWIEKKNESES